MIFYINKLYTVEYLIILSFIILSVILSLVILTASYVLALQNPDLEKISTYECGFEPFEDARNKFDVRFYIVAILFLIFDIEVVYLFPWAISLYSIGMQGFWIMVIFLIILTLGFLYEVVKGALDW